MQLTIVLPLHLSTFLSEQILLLPDLSKGERQSLNGLIPRLYITSVSVLVWDHPTNGNENREGLRRAKKRKSEGRKVKEKWRREKGEKERGREGRWRERGKGGEEKGVRLPSGTHQSLLALSLPLHWSASSVVLGLYSGFRMKRDVTRPSE